MTNSVLSKPGACIAVLALRAGAPYYHLLSVAEQNVLKYPISCDPALEATSEKGREVFELCRNAAEIFSSRIHADNVAAGWWTDLETNKPKERNIGELLMLVVTELVEANHGYDTNISDDKLPQFPMVSVEIADALIRVGDIAGRFCPAFAEVLSQELFKQPETGLHVHPLHGTIYIAQAMEKARKGKDFSLELAKFVVWALRFCIRMRINIGPIMDAKLDFNASRPDHKLENRKAADGKKF